MKYTIWLKKNSDFLRLYKKGKFYVGKFIVLYSFGNNIAINRVGITVSKKVAKSVKRNRLRRHIKECYRLYEELLIKGMDLVFVVRENKVLPGYYEIKREMKYLLKKLCIFNEKPFSEE